MTNARTWIGTLALASALTGGLALPRVARAEDEGADARARLVERMRALDAERERVRRELDSLDAPAQDDAVPAPDTAERDEEPSGRGPGPEVERAIVVVAKRRASDPRLATASVLSFGTADLERRQSTHVHDVLQEAPGVNVVTDGPRGQFTRLFIRGAASNQALVMIDGVPQNDATTGGGYDLGDLTTAGVERVEVLKGSYGVLYGSEAIGGVVNVVTRRGRGEPGGFVRLEAGSFDTHREVLGFGGESDAADFAFTLENTGSHGDRKNEDYRQHTLMGRFGLDLSPRVRIETNVRYADSEVDSPFDFASAGVLPPDSNLIRGRQSFSVGATLAWDATDWLAIRAGGSLLDVDSTFDNGPDGFNTIDPDFTPGSGDEYTVIQDELRSNSGETDTRARLEATVDLGQAAGWDDPQDGGFGAELTIGGEWLDQDSVSISTFPDFNAPTSTTMRSSEETTTESYFAQADLYLPALPGVDSGVLTLGVRDDEHSEFGSEDSPFVGVRFDVPALDVTLRGSYGEGFRAPKPSELFDPFVGNTGLGPETSKSWDAGGVVRLFDGDLELGATFFDLETDDLIAYVATATTPSRPFGRLVNITETETRGWEYSARANLGSGFTLRGSLTSQNPRDRNTGALLPNRVKHFGSAGVSWKRGDFRVSLDGFFSGSIPHAGGTFTYPESHERTDPGKRRVVNLTARYRLDEQVTLFGRVENLLDDDYVTTPSAPAGSPLGVFLGAQFEF